MTDLPDPAAEGAATDVTPGLTASNAGDPDLAALVRTTSAVPLDGDPDLAALVKLGQRPVSSAVPTAGGEAAAAVSAATVVDAVASDAVLTDASPESAPPVVADSEPDAVDATAAEPVPGAATTPADPAPADDAAAAAAEPEAAADDQTVPADELPVAAAVAEAPAGPSLEGEIPHRGRSLALRFTFAFLLGVLLVVGIGAGGLYAWGQQYDGRVLPGVHVGSTDLSGLTRDQAQAAIAKAYASLGTGTITLTGPNGPVTVAYADISRGPDTAAILDAALAAGRGGEPLANLVGAPQAAIHGVTVASAVTYDRAKLAAAVDALAAGIDQQAVNASIAADASGAYTVGAAKDGRAVDKAALLAALDQKLAALDSPAQIAFDIPVATITPAVETTVADAAKAAADRMAADMVIARGTDTWTITSAQLKPLITFGPTSDGTFTPVLNQSGIDPLVKALAKQINQSAQEAGLKLVNNHVVATGKSREGRTLNVAAMTTAILNQLAARQAGTAVEPVQAVVKAVQPKLTSDSATKYAAKMVPISHFSVYYWVIVNNHFGGNIEAPATKINGTIVPAGATFDFWKVVGDLHKLPGEGPGNAIEGGKITVTGAFGGGICTTSTTLFNAAIHAGMIPLARQNHNEFIDRYPAGLDATVWIVGNTKQTMSFKNDTAYPILIQRIITYAGSKRWLTFKIWSVPNGRTTKITNTVIQHTQAAVDTIVKDPTKPVGYTFRNNSPVNGANVWVTVSIYDHGKLHWTKRYYSHYPAVNGVLVVGTG
jgi:vancomycin resistance protein YoaR